MATRIVMEALSPTMEEGRLVAWKKKEGDKVTTGETLAEVETDKAVMELVARGDGVLRKIVLGEGATVPVGALVAIVGTADEDIANLTGSGVRGPGSAKAGVQTPPPVTKAPAPELRPASPGPRTPEPGPRPVAPGPLTPGPGSRIKSSPLARRMARDRGVDLTLVTGSGPAGRVVKRDVETAGRTDAQTHGRTVAAIAAPAPPEGGFRDEPLTAMRKTIARRLTQSIGPVPHFFLTTEIDMERAWRPASSSRASARRTRCPSTTWW
jgi:pyruvate dehydrogenase E2 component (dihydrolipoamide acetyltransferase)